MWISAIQSISKRFVNLDDKPGHLLEVFIEANLCTVTEFLGFAFNEKHLSCQMQFNRQRLADSSTLRPKAPRHSHAVSPGKAKRKPQEISSGSSMSRGIFCLVLCRMRATIGGNWSRSLRSEPILLQVCRASTHRHHSPVPRLKFLH